MECNAIPRSQCPINNSGVSPCDFADEKLVLAGLGARARNWPVDFDRCCVL